MDCAAEVYSAQNSVEEGLLILRISFPTSGAETEVSILQNFTESSEFTLNVSEAIEMLPLNEVLDSSLTLEMSIEFASPD